MANEQPPTPSSTAIALRRSYQLGPLEVVFLGVGAWILIGVFGGFEQLRGLAGGQSGMAHLLFALLLIPTALTHVELRHWIRQSGGSYRLLQRLERPALTFLAGWSYLLAWAGLSALIAWTFAGQLSLVLDLLGWPQPGLLPTAIGFTLFIAMLNAAGRRPPWRLAVRFGALLAMGLLVLVLALLRSSGSATATAAASPAAAGSLFSAVAALGATLWLLELLSERQRINRLVQITLPGALLGPILAAGLAYAAIRLGAGNLTIEAMAESALPGVGQALTLAMGLLSALLLWPALSLIMLRQLQTIGADGVLPAWLLHASPKLGNPTRLALFQGVLTSLALLAIALIFAEPADVSLALLNLTAVVFLLLQFMVNLGSILLVRQQRAQPDAFRLPLFPIIPATGAAINFLLLLALPSWTRVVVLLWLALGAIIFWQAGRKRMHAAQLGITVFQDALREPVETSHYPVIVPIANPDTAAGLVSLGAAIAQARGGHMVLLQVIQVPEHLPLDTRRYEARKKQDLLEQLLAEAERYDILVEGVTRLSRSVTQGILDTVAEESAKMVVMGSNVRPQLGSSGFGKIVDSVLEGAACEVAVVSGGDDLKCNCVLVPVSDEAQGREAAKLALAVTAATGGKVKLLHVARTADGEAGVLTGKAILVSVLSGIETNGRIEIEVETAGSPLEGILKVSEGADLILLGASEQGLLEEEHFGPLPLQLAMRAQVPLMLTRSHAALPAYVARRAWRSLADLLPRLSSEEQIEVYRRLRVAARPSVNYFVLITLSAVIASLGLLLDSPAVVIGAMLVAPLMSPIVAAAIGITFGDTRTLRDGMTATLQGMLAAIFIAILITLLVPGAKASDEVLARAQPTLVDLIVALASGMAGAYAIARKEVGEALPGVAIAAALLPPLSSVGVGIALADASIAGGALLLFTTNLIAIIFASALVFLLLGMRPPRVEERKMRLRQGLVISVLSLALVSIPLGFFLWQTVQRDSIENQARIALAQGIEGWGAVHLQEFSVRQQGNQLVLQGTIYADQPIEQDEIAALQLQLERALDRQVSLQIFVLQGELLEVQSR